MYLMIGAVSESLELESRVLTQYCTDGKDSFPIPRAYKFENGIRFETVKSNLNYLGPGWELRLLFVTQQT